MKRIDTDGTENINFPDGTKVIVKVNGERTLLLPSGQKEIHTSAYKVNTHTLEFLITLKNITKNYGSRFNLNHGKLFVLLRRLECEIY